MSGWSKLRGLLCHHVVKDQDESLNIKKPYELSISPQPLTKLYRGPASLNLKLNFKLRFRSLNVTLSLKPEPSPYPQI